MLTNKKISIFGTFLVMLLTLGITNHVILIPLLLQSAGRDAWIGILFTAVLQIGWVFLFYLIMKRTKQQSIFEWFKNRCGRVLGWIFALTVAVYCFFTALIMVRETTTWINATFLPLTPKLVVSISLVSLCVFIAYHGIRSIAIVSGILLPVVWILGHFVALANMQYKDYSLLTPLFVNGYKPVLQSMVVAGGGFMEIIVLIFIQHHISKKIKYWHLIILVLLLAGLTAGPVAGAIANFGPAMAMNARYPAYDQWMLVTVTKYITHLDFFALYQWISGAVIRTALFLYILVESSGIPKSKSRLWLLLPLGAAITGLSLHPFIDKHIELYILGEYALVSLFFLMLLTIIILFTTFLPIKNKGDKG